MNNLPLVSVITPSYNQAAYIEETIISVLKQDYENVEYIIIDGGSNDGSAELIKKYEKHLSYWISEKDMGQADAINKGFARATGEFLCWINSDDILYPGFVSQRIKQFQQYPDVDMIYGDVDQGPEQGNSWLRKGRQTSSKSMIRTLEIPIPQQSAMWRRRVLEMTGLLDPEWNVLLDRDYFIRIADNHNILYTPGALAFFRVHKDSKSINEAIRWAEEFPAYYNSLIGQRPDYKKYKREVMSRCYWSCGNIYRENHDPVKAAEFLQKSKKESLRTYSLLRFIQLLVRVKQTMRHKLLFNRI